MVDECELFLAKRTAVIFAARKADIKVRQVAGAGLLQRNRIDFHAVGGALEAEPLVVDSEILPFLEFILVLLHHFPALVFPLKNLNALAF